jgi:hypothetical protein
MALFIQWKVTVGYLDIAETNHLIREVEQTVTVNVANTTTEPNQPAAAITAAFASPQMSGLANPFVDPVGGGNVNRNYHVNKLERVGQVTA